jgi:hypothetical protein
MATKGPALDCPEQLNCVELSHGHPGAIAIQIGAK